MSAITAICKHGNVVSKFVCGFCENTALTSENRSLREALEKISNYDKGLWAPGLWEELAKSYESIANEALKISSGEK